ncbi:putative transcription initiation factor TFIID, 31kD subunit [Aspergillus clavatus NRRL 1]|uniref:Transcription initiation factor TFIID, 31kD subunit, putative n=1 Tax=Aspergillus clavatus (strain ATCC 1007 / CBS 513.65 / DSM 816 / NCTC 3887 / NRRL 1 / QM 1276 / 107) TaxID=344612 RepID=A1CP04_ASPCL|nr:transcription initiation factor TFIID, 31kD subunit, putative [Aspergillus clavatus NRRL 1]EAW07375.1 transcription initiation factor TFIID, 31kD subunit, putative [Aspergillus clavatus NRRL 1]
MASPAQTQAPASSSNQPLTPPAEPSSTNPIATTSSQPAHAPNTNNTTNNTTMPSSSSNNTAQPAQIPSTSLKDSGKSRRPRDVRLIHMLLASLGVTAYQERVPLQLLDFAYRYTSGVLQDAVHLATEGYAGAVGDGGGGAGRGPVEVNSVSLPALRLSIASRLHYQFQTGLPKEFLLDVAAERNRVALPGAARGFDSAAAQAKSAAQVNQSVIMGGMRLPPERFCLTGTGWDMKDEWESEGEEEVETEGEGDQAGAAEREGKGGEAGAGVKEEEAEGDEDDDDGDGKMEDIFGEDTAMGEGDGEDEDKAMTDV